MPDVVSCAIPNRLEIVAGNLIAGLPASYLGGLGTIVGTYYYLVGDILRSNPIGFKRSPASQSIIHVHL